jgi:hypothetical protein
VPSLDEAVGAVALDVKRFVVGGLGLCDAQASCVSGQRTRRAGGWGIALARVPGGG